MFGSKSSEKSKSLIAIISSEQVRNDIQFITAKLEDVQSAIKFTTDTLRDGRELVNGSADIVIIEADLGNPDSDVVLKQLCEYVSQNGSLIVLGKNVTLANTRTLFKMGVNDVLELPLTREDILVSLETAFGEQIKKSQSFDKSGQIITMMKCGGGVGATTLATNIAHAIMTDGQTKKFKFGKKSPMQEAPRVAVFDFDIQFGTVAISLNVDTRTGILDVRKAEDRLDASLLSDTIRSHGSGLKLLASPPEIVPFEAFSSDFFSQLLPIGQAMFDYIIVDLPQAWTEWTQTVLDHSDLIVPVMTPGVEHVHNCKKILQGLDHLKISRSDTLVAINKIAKGVASNDRIAQIKKIVERDITLIRDDQKVHLQARDRGTLLHEISGSAGSLKNISQCALKILSQLESNNNSMATTPLSARAEQHSAELR